MSERAPREPGKGILEHAWIYVLILAALVFVGYVFHRSGQQGSAKRDVAPLEDTVSKHPLQDADMPALALAIGHAWAGESVDRASLPARMAEPAQAVYVAFRAGGRQLESLWVHPDALEPGATMWDALAEALERGAARLAARRGEVTRLEIDLTHDYRALDYAKQKAQVLDEPQKRVHRHRGVRGLRVRSGERMELWAPTWQVATNEPNSELLAELRGRWGIGEPDLAAAEITSFEADQVLVRLDRAPVEAVLMFRGNRIVDVSEVDASSTEALAVGMKDWLVHNVRADGRLTYMLYPSTGRESREQNMIRQWMATNALIRWAHDRNDQAVFDLAAKNIDYNLAQFYTSENGLGRINERNGSGVKVKLGAVALAGMALHTHPQRERWASQLAGLRAMVDHLWHEDGSFSSFYVGDTKEWWNFYPGEALLFWATIYAEEKDPELLRKFKRSQAFFKAWHLDPKNRNPAFVPWHLQANYAMAQALGEDEAEFERELVAYSFEMADWLVDVQQWTPEQGITHADEKGRFYKHKFGIPHASSTGVYIEGLIDAWQFAREVGDATREERYRVSLVRAIRSMMQLQFVDDVDLFYVADPTLVVGGLRTAEYDNEIRCDNVQHPLMGIIKIIRMFEADDYARAE